MRDMLDREFQVGDYVAKAMYSAYLSVKRVTKINENGVYLGKATNPLRYPSCVLIVTDVTGVQEK